MLDLEGGGLEVPHRLEKETSASEDAGSRSGWIVRSHVGWGGERNILYKGVEASVYQTCFKNLEGKPERKSPKRTISASSVLGPLQMVSKPDTG